MASLFENIRNLFISQPDKKSKPLKEGYLPDAGAMWQAGFLWGDMYNRQGSYGYNSFAPIANTSDRLNGFDFPYVYSLADHLTYLANSRYIGKVNPYAIGMVNALSSYVLGEKGISATVTSDDEELTKLVQDLLEIWYNKTNFDTLQIELFERSIVDGEYFLRKFFQKDGFLKLRTIEPEHIQIPIGYDPLAASMGVVCDPEDPQTVLGYGVYTYKGTKEASTIEFVEADEIIHDKKLVTQAMKRGRPAFIFDTGAAFLQAAKLARNIASMATTQASVAFIRQHATATAAQVQDFADSQNSNFVPPFPQWGTASSYSGAGGYASSSILDVPKTLEHVNPPSAGNIGNYIEALNMCLREAGRLWNAPEWLISGKGDSINYASSLTTESPFLRSITKQQKDFKETIDKIMEAVIQNFAISGLIPLDYKSKNLKINLVAPSIETREYLKEAQLNKIYLDMGIKSPQTISHELGLNFATEQENFASLQKNPKEQEKDAGI
jgi:hypothetical protein